MKRHQTLEEYCQRYAVMEALYRAKQEVKAQLRAEGKKVNNYSAKEIDAAC